MLEEKIHFLLREGWQKRYYSFAVTSIVRKNSIQYFSFPEESYNLFFDLASLTKPFTGYIIFKLYLGSKIDLTTPISYWYGKKVTDTIKVYHLLKHCSGISPYYPFFEHYREEERGDLKVREEIIKKITELPLSKKPGEEAIYSDLNYILLYDIIEKVCSNDYKFCFNKFICEELNLEEIFFIRAGETVNKDNFAPTGYSKWRVRELKGEVNDDNCYLLGGVCGHAGLFSNILTLSAFVQKLICEELKIPFNYYIPKKKERFTITGWDTPTLPASTAGTFFTEGYTIGHLGFTGCSIWIDLKRKIAITLLSNRSHFNTPKEIFNNFRRRLYDLIMEGLLSR